MKALIFEAPHEAVVSRYRSSARSARTRCSVKSHAVGICHSDFELYEGRYIIPVSYPIIPGHEWCGEVVEAGSAVGGLQPVMRRGRMRRRPCRARPFRLFDRRRRRRVLQGARRVAAQAAGGALVHGRARWSSRSRSPTTPPSWPAESTRRTWSPSSAAGRSGCSASWPPPRTTQPSRSSSRKQARRDKALESGRRAALDPDRPGLRRRRAAELTARPRVRRRDRGGRLSGRDGERTRGRGAGGTGRLRRHRRRRRSAGASSG